MKQRHHFSVSIKETFHDATDSAKQTIGDSLTTDQPNALDEYRHRHTEHRYSNRDHLDPAAGDYEPILRGKTLRVSDGPTQGFRASTKRLGGAHHRLPRSFEESHQLVMFENFHVPSEFMNHDG